MHAVVVHDLGFNVLHKNWWGSVLMFFCIVVKAVLEGTAKLSNGDDVQVTS